MQLFLVQHAEAKAETEDPKRPLTERGVSEIRKVTHHLRNTGISIEVIYHSEKLRARQTAEALATVFNPTSGIQERKGLAPNDPVKPFAEELEICSQALMVVSHLPFLARLASYLIAGNEDKGLVNFRMAGVVALVKDNGGWKVDWILVPELV